jgi:hypothetical protein
MSTGYNNSTAAVWNSNNNKMEQNIIESYPQYPTAPTLATNKRTVTRNSKIADEPIELSPPASPSPSIVSSYQEKRSYTAPYIKQDIILPTPVSTPDSFRIRREYNIDNSGNDIEQVILKRHSTMSSVRESLSNDEPLKTLTQSPSIISLGRSHTTGHTLKSARQRTADKEKLQLMRRSEEFQKELSARRKTFKRLSRLMDHSKTEEPEEDRVLMGTRISEGHQNYVLMYNMLTGIRIAVSRVTAKVDRPLTDEDFVAAHKLAFDVIGDELTPGAKYDFKFKDYAPWVFRHLREKFGVDPADYLVKVEAYFFCLYYILMFL